MNLLKLTGETSQLLCLQALAISDFTVATEMDFGLPCPEWATFMSRLNGVVAAEGLGRTGGAIWIYRGGASSITWSDAASSKQRDPLPFCEKLRQGWWRGSVGDGMDQAVGGRW
jgi:hypothetical protein